eukprot:TRINITY_DN7185_c0_g1_i1.p1 TRINITY_DN7185_c0_g1~~TRINITY_DN7185_c0_g1_i1.p1  ORF type:complete len:344 (+),score=81.76 TRINITY_DN7185_c0_g1_i1:282-1313(+)
MKCSSSVSSEEAASRNYPEIEASGMTSSEEAPGADDGEAVKEGNSVAESRALENGTSSGSSSSKVPALVIAKTGIGNRQQCSISSEQGSSPLEESRRNFASSGDCRNDEARPLSPEERQFQPLESGENPSTPRERDSITPRTPVILPRSEALQSSLSVSNVASHRTNNAEGDAGKAGKRKAKRLSLFAAKNVEDSPDLEKGLGDNASVKIDGGNASTTTMAIDDDGEHVCRVCHLNSEGRPGSSDLINLGCECKDDLSLAHRHCAEAWFKIRGNRVCEICGETANNIVGSVDAQFMEEWNERDVAFMEHEDRRCWRRQRLCNILLGFMVIAFILPWFFRVSMF